ncbi:MAG TPA: exopolysaccharide biosynthesis polyprenyl glycosylphosphotransferase, partial [Gaiellaceae bacterium]|nr:exopolysaccharide biosynthesis polyprenyl glycosylphosphotransferase [Gaiellaceae bacterium]
AADVGGFDGLRHVVEQERVERVIVAPTSTDAAATLELVRLCKLLGVQVSVLPRIFEVVGSAVVFDDVDGMTLLGVRRFGLSRGARATKRAFDLVVAGLATLVLSPLLVLIALAVRLDSPGPVFFKQLRVGRDGRHFGIYKFRTMVADAEARKAGLRAGNEAGDGLFKIADDPRITRAGRLLRKASLDELPQLLNVVKGDMSLVGPRPLVLDEDAQIAGLDRQRLHLTPGMTGPWQVLGSARTPMSEMVGMDYLYVATWSLWKDLKLLVRTVAHVLQRGNA